MADIYDVTIIGGGPAGLYSAFWAGLRGLKTKIIEALPELGGQLITLYPGKNIYDAPGYEAVLARDLVAKLVAQGCKFKPTICLNEKMLSLNNADGLWQVVTDQGNHQSKTVVFAVGVGAGSARRLGITYDTALDGKSVFYAVHDRQDFRGDVLIVGGGDSAVDWAIDFSHSKLASSVSIAHRSDVFKAVKSSSDEMVRNGVSVLAFQEVTAICAAGSKLSVTLTDNRDQKQTTLVVDRLLFCLGFAVSLDFLENAALTLANNAIPVDPLMATNLSGVYAAGDIAAYSAKLKLIATAFGDAATAINFAAHHLDPTARANPGHSSNLKL